MVIYVGENEEVRIQEIDEENGDLRVGVYDESIKGKSILLTIFDKNDIESIARAEKFAQDFLYMLKSSENEGKKRKSWRWSK